MILCARFNPDSPGKLVDHAFSYEHREVAAYELLADRDALEAWHVFDEDGLVWIMGSSRAEKP
jgi:hypothetical protein